MLKLIHIKHLQYFKNSIFFFEKAFIIFVKTKNYE